MSDPQYVYSSDGRRGVIVQGEDPATDDRRFMRVRFGDGPDLTVPAELLELRPDGAFDLNAGHEELRQARNAGPRREPNADDANGGVEPVESPIRAE